jgi:transcriptional regulator with XRE-family HTH domain
MPRVTSNAAAHIGQRIAERRRQLALTQDQLAAGSGIDSSNIRAYESGRATPSIHSLTRIAEALNCEPGSLLEGLSSDLFGVIERDGRRREVK